MIGENNKKMKGNKIKIIITLLLIGGIIALLRKFPEETILLMGIGAIIIIGLWVIEVDEE